MVNAGGAAPSFLEAEKARLRGIALELRRTHCGGAGCEDAHCGGASGEAAVMANFATPLSRLPAFRAARTVAAFLPLPAEPDVMAAVMAMAAAAATATATDTTDETRHGQKICRNAAKRVAVPAWDAESLAYFFCELTPGAALAESRFGVREPVEKLRVATEEIDVFLVPGLLFDATGNRLGHGKGFYDRLLAPRRADAVVLGVAFDWQLSPAPIPAGPHDARMDAVITPENAEKSV